MIKPKFNNLGPGIQKSYEQNTTDFYVSGILKFD